MNVKVVMYKSIEVLMCLLNFLMVWMVDIQKWFVVCFNAFMF